MTQAERQELSRALERLADGDRQAFDFVFEKTRPILSRLAVKMLGPGPEVDDIAQSALLKVFSRAKEFEAGRDALSWILGIGVFECRTFKKKSLRLREDTFDSPEALNLADPSGDQEAALLQRELEQALSEVLNTLNANDRETIMASIMNEKRPTIAAATFRKRLQRALGRLRNQWEEAHGE